MFKSLIQPLQLFIKGASGKDRHQKQQLAQQLISLQVAYDRLQESCETLQHEHDTLQRNVEQLQKRYSKLQRDRNILQRDRNELNALFNYADKENKGLDAEKDEMRSRIQKLEAEKAALHSKVVFLEHKLGLRAYESGTNNDQADANSKAVDSQPASLLSTAEPLAPTAADVISANLEPNLGAEQDTEFMVDLSDVSLALVGGHETTHREVAEELKKYGLKRCIHVPPHSRESNNRHQIRDKISNCDLVVTITSYVDHSVSNCVKQLRDTQMLTGEVIRVHCHGKSGVVREVLQYFAT